MTMKSGKSVCLHTVTMIDPAIDKKEKRTVPSAQTDLVSNQVGLVTYSAVGLAKNGQ